MKLTLVFSLIFLSQVVFGQKHQQIMFPPPVLGMEDPEFTDACELPAHKGELVYTRFIYRGMKEYWGLYPEKKCNKIYAELVIPKDVDIQPDDLKEFKAVRKNYRKKYLIVDVIGTFEDGKLSGYGYLGSNNSKFTVKYVVHMYGVNKKP